MSDENFLLKTLNDTVLSRRSFLKWSAALGGTAALAGGLGVGLKAIENAAEQEAAEGKWISAACWHNCGGRCVNKAYVVDGVIIRQKTDDNHPDSPDYPQMRGCARGRSQRYQVFGADRLKYPMVRKNWEPGGGDKELRGRDEWVRISWDEALDIVASEIKRIKEAYGNEAILLPGGGEIGRMLDLYGGCVAHWGAHSRGTWGSPVSGIIGAYSWGASDRLDYRNSKLIVMWAENPIWASGGNPTYNYLQAKRAGAKFIFIDPFYNDSAQVLADEWIPIRPATDTSMLLAIAYVLLTEDDTINNPLIDWDFLDRCTIGFDKEHLPEGADPEDNFQDYVLGLDASGNTASEGHKNYPAKTPEWASEICGVPPERIRRFAREIATTKPTAFLCGYSMARVHKAYSIPQAFLAVGAMIGSMGVSGGGVGPSTHGHACDRAREAPRLVNVGGTGVPGIESTRIRLNHNDMWNAVLNGEYISDEGSKEQIDIRMIYHGGSNRLQTDIGQATGIVAHRAVEFVVAQNFVLTSSVKYADVVLPVTTQWERYDSFTGGLPNTEISQILASQITEPLFEARDDIWIAKEIGVRLGLDPEVIDPVPPNQQLFNQLAGAEVITEDGSAYEKLVTITAEDIAEMGVEGEPQRGRISLKEFKEKGVYQVKRYPGDNYGFIAYKDFRDDPEGHPLSSESGKLEIHSQALADRINSWGWETIRPIPTYIPPTEGYEDTFADWENKIKGDYPLQLFTIHYGRRSHTIFDNVSHLRRAFPQEFFMNPIDAEARGITQGDTVLVTGLHGKCLRPAYLTERLMPGVVILPHGAWVEVDEETGIDEAGSDNYIQDIPATHLYAPYNSIVQVEKYEGPIELLPDYQWPQRIPIKEA
ncbi:MAG: molybdopterin-dependent oxidoreductase [Anaerolineales bacterium]